MRRHSFVLNSLSSSDKTKKGKESIQPSQNMHTNIASEPLLVAETGFHDGQSQTKWSSEIHHRFINAVNDFGGPNKAPVEAILRAIEVPDLTLSDFKSILQTHKNELHEVSVAESSKEIKDGLSNSRANIQYKADEASTGCNNAHPDISSTFIESVLAEKSIFSEAIQQQLDSLTELQQQLQENKEIQKQLELKIEKQVICVESVITRSMAPENQPPEKMKRKKIHPSRKEAAGTPSTLDETEHPSIQDEDSTELASPTSLEDPPPMEIKRKKIHPSKKIDARARKSQPRNIDLNLPPSVENPSEFESN